MPFVVEASGKENVVPVRLLIRERLGFLNADCVIGNGQGNASPPKQRKKGKHDGDLSEFHEAFGNLFLPGPPAVSEFPQPLKDLCRLVRHCSLRSHKQRFNR